LSVDSGAYVLTGADATLVFSPLGGAFVLIADSGSYAIVGSNAVLRYSEEVLGTYIPQFRRRRR